MRTKRIKQLFITILASTMLCSVAVPAYAADQAALASENKVSAAQTKTVTRKKNGVVKGSDGVLRYYKNGKVNKKYNSVAKYGKKWYKFKNGVVDKTYTGIAKRVETNKLYYIKKGVMNKKFTGIARIPGTKKYYLVKKGKVATSYTGIYKYKNKFYYIKKGRWQRTFNGKYTNTKTGKTYTVKKGYYTKKKSAATKKTYLSTGTPPANFTYDKKKITGVHFTGTQVLVDVKGKGRIAYKDDGSWDSYRQKGMIYTLTTASELKRKNGKDYVYRDGKWDKTYTGLVKVKGKDDTTWYYYAKNGIVDPTYTGYAKLPDDSRFCNVGSNEKQYIKNGKTHAVHNYSVFSYGGTGTKVMFLYCEECGEYHEEWSFDDVFLRLMEKYKNDTDALKNHGMMESDFKSVESFKKYLMSDRNKKIQNVIIRLGKTIGAAALDYGRPITLEEKDKTWFFYAYKNGKPIKTEHKARDVLYNKVDEKNYYARYGREHVLPYEWYTIS